MGFCQVCQVLRVRGGWPRKGQPLARSFGLDQGFIDDIVREDANAAAFCFARRGQQGDVQGGAPLRLRSPLSSGR